MKSKQSDIYRFEGETLYITCTKCNIEKEATNNHYGNKNKGRGSKYGFLTICKLCNKLKQDRYKKQHPDKVARWKKLTKINRREFAVYKILDNNGNIIYVGKANNMKERLKDHLNITMNKGRYSTFRDDPSIIHRVFVKNYNNSQENTAVEVYYIAKYKPPYNKRDTKTGEPSKWLEPLAESQRWKEFDIHRIMDTEYNYRDTNSEIKIKTSNA